MSNLIVDKVLMMCRAMSADELKNVVIGMKPMIDTLLPQEAELAKTVAVAGKSGGSRRSNRPMPLFWVREATGFDDSKNGMYKVQGDFVYANKIADLKTGRLLIIGAKAVKGHYFVVRTAGKDAKFDAHLSDDEGNSVHVVFDGASSHDVSVMGRDSALAFVKDAIGELV